MATKFSSLYKQELKSKGSLESLGSTVVKSMAERVDLRNILFGGKGFIGKTGRKIFGKGYDPLDRAKRITPDSSAAVSAIASLQESNKRQEDALKIIVKNTMNMNMMARDMNITRQNIASMTKSITGKSSKGADALWMSASRRNREGTSPSKEGSSGSIVSGILGGMMGIGGSVGSGIFRALGSIIAISPILGIVGIAAAGYAIKQMADSVDFSGMFKSIKDNILKFLGIDPDSDKPLLKQLAERLDSIFKTDKFSSIYDWINETFGPSFKKIGSMIEETNKHIITYSGAAFKILGEGFGKLGDIFAFHFGEFINRYKPELLATIGASIGVAVGSIFGLKGAAIGGVISGTVGFAIGKITQTRSTQDIEDDLAKAEKNFKNAQQKLEDYKPSEPAKVGRAGQTPVDPGYDYKRMYLESDVTSAQSSVEQFREELKKQQEKLRSLGVSSQMNGVFNNTNWQRALEEERLKYESNRPTREILDEEQKRMAKMIYDEFKTEFGPAIALAAVANAYRESRLRPRETNLKGEKSIGLFQVNMNDPNNFEFLSKRGYTEQSLLDPKTNIKAMIDLIKSSPGNLEKLRKEKTLEGITENLSTNFLRPANAEAEARIRTGYLTTADRLLEGSNALNDALRSIYQPNPVIINNNNTTSSPISSQPAPGASAYNIDVAELFLRVQTMNA